MIVRKRAQVVMFYYFDRANKISGMKAIKHLL